MTQEDGISVNQVLTSPDAGSGVSVPLNEPFRPPVSEPRLAKSPEVNIVLPV